MFDHFATHLHPCKCNCLLKPLLEIRVNLTQLPLLMVELLVVAFHALQLQVDAGKLVLDLQLFLCHSLKVLAKT